MGSNGITAEKACEITRSSEMPEVVKKELERINRSIESKVKENGLSVLVSFLKENMSVDELELITQDLKGRGFRVASGDVVD